MPLRLPLGAVVGRIASEWGSPPTQRDSCTSGPLGLWDLGFRALGDIIHYFKGPYKLPTYAEGFLHFWSFRDLGFKALGDIVL